jgi:hypothetical protein
MQIDRNSSSFGQMLLAGAAFALGGLGVTWLITKLAQVSDEDDEEDDSDDP